MYIRTATIQCSWKLSIQIKSTANYYLPSNKTDYIWLIVKTRRRHETFIYQVLNDRIRTIILHFNTQAISYPRIGILLIGHTFSSQYYLIVRSVHIQITIYCRRCVLLLLRWYRCQCYCASFSISKIYNEIKNLTYFSFAFVSVYSTSEVEHRKKIEEKNSARWSNKYMVFPMNFK